MNIINYIKGAIYRYNKTLLDIRMYDLALLKAVHKKTFDENMAIGALKQEVFRLKEEVLDVANERLKVSYIKQIKTNILICFVVAMAVLTWIIS